MHDSGLKLSRGEHKMYPLQAPIMFVDC